MKTFYTYPAPLSSFATATKAFGLLKRLPVTMLLTAIAIVIFSAISQQANARDNWTNSDNYWTVSYNVVPGTITVRVLVYDDEYGPANEDGFIDYAHLKYSTDGSSYDDFYYIDYNSGPSLQSSSGPRGSAGATYTSATETNNGRNKTYWTVTLPLTNALSDIRKIKIEGNWDVNGAFNGSDDINSDKDISITKMSAINNPTYDFVTVQNGSVFEAKARIAYTKISLNAVDNLSTIRLYNSNGVAVSNPVSVATSGTTEIAISSAPLTYYYQQSAYSGRVFVNSGNVTIPAFTLPLTASAIYDTVTQKVTFTWTINAVIATNLVTDGFKMQIANNPNFTDARDVTGLAYDKTQTTYTYTVQDRDLAPQMYIRIARARQGFNWELAKTASITIPFNPISNASLTLQNDNTARLTWNPRATSWLPGSSFIITRINNTSKSQNEIKLTKAEFDLGQYIDQQIAICNQYTYTLQVVPPATSSFTAFAAVQFSKSILPTEIGTISNLVVSKGYFPDRTELRWSAQGAFDNFIVKRAVYGTTNYVQLSSVTGSSNSDYQADDPKGTPGIYYTYMVVGVVKCNNTPVYSKDTLYAIGFRSPTGNIYGRVTYENGQAVEDVAVRLQSNDETQLGKSILLNGNSQSFLMLDSLQQPFSDTALTVETWIKPTDQSPVNQVVFSRTNQYELGFNATGQLYFMYRSQAVTGTYANTAQGYVHVAGIHTKDSLFILLNGQIIGRRADAYQPATSVAKQVYIGRNQAGNYFKGNIDEMRVWNIAVESSKMERDYTRLLAGNERGLVAYWRFDETISNQFYDASHRGDQYNQNDGKMNTAQVVRSGVIPSAGQLSLKAYTDVSGNYFISGIPFSGNGTTYTIVPLLGTHQFDPVSVNRLVSANSTEFTVDFKDKSSFPVSGFVYYKDGTVPVPGVQFKIDGQFAQQSNGSIIETDDNGRFTISVPVGTHEVMAVKNNHVFVNNGKITDVFGNNLNYQGPVSSRVLIDSTRIRFIGRVGGGAIQEAYPVGHSLSANNLGKDQSITLALPSGNKYELFSQQGNNVAQTVTNIHLLPSNQTDSNKIRSSRVEYQRNKIVIYPNPVTGEFIADLLPEKFIASSVDVTGWGDVLDGKPVLMDFSNKFQQLYSINSYRDSLVTNLGTYIYQNYVDTVRYNAVYKFIKRQSPVIDIAQKDNSGKNQPYFGNRVFESLSFTGRKDTIPVVDTSKTGINAYLYGRPVFIQNQQVRFTVKAFEQYPFYESVLQNGTLVVKQVSGKDVVDKVPTSDGLVSVLNSLRNGSSQPDTFRLNNQGAADYVFTAGDPDLAAAGVKDLAVSIKFGQATNINWNFLGNPQLKAYVMGGKLTGTDFVTAGPDKLLMVLRDPPGSKSYSYAEVGSTITESSTYSGSFDQEGDLDLTQKLGAELVTFTGIGVGTINSAVATTGFTLGVRHEEHYTYTNVKETSTRLTTRFQTSDDPLFVGPPGDVYVGYSTNITYGQSNNITLIKRGEVKATDKLLYEPNAVSQYVIVQRGGINIGENFATLFAFTQQHVEKILIPNLINIRNTALLPPTTPATDAQNLANNTGKPVYVSKLAASHPNFGKSNSDTVAFANAAKTDAFDNGQSYKIYFPALSNYRNDTILTLNQYITAWKARMYDNEKAKLEASLLQNYSFQAGSPISYSTSTSIRETSTNAFNFIISGSVTNSTDVKIQGNGFEFKFRESIGTNQGGVFTTNTDTTTTLGFNLASRGTDDYFSVDVKKADDNSLVFITRGGVSGCPYMGQTVTSYYQPGTTIDQPTQRAEVPKISVDKPVVNDIPTSRKASYNLTLRNESEARLPATFVIGYVDNDSIKGATIAIDGSPIGGAGRAVVVQFGETVTKVLTLTKGPNAMDYNNIMILLRSSCQYDPTGYQENIADTVLISAHFIPSCSDVSIKSPKDKWVLNSESPENAQGKRYLPITIDQFDVTNPLFNHIALQYKPASTSTWITAMQFYADTTLLNAAQGEKQLITNAQAILYNLVLDDATFNDQNYDVQAVSYCQVGPGNFVTTESNLVSGIKDTYYPRLFGTPQPANGILGISDDVRLNFNETIAAGLLTYADFQVTGIRNGVKGDHSVSVSLDGKTNYLATEFSKNLNSKNITAELWVLADKSAAQTVFSHGNAGTSMALSVTADNYLQATVGSTTIKADRPFTFKQGEWAHVALRYNANSRTVSAFYNFVEMINNAPVAAYTGSGIFEFGRNIATQSNYFGGKLHEARIWNDTLTGIQLQVNSLSQLSGAENGLLAYYPMNEGKGTICFDKAHGSNAKLTGLWSTPPGKAISVNGNGYVRLNTGFAPITSQMDYTIELWFKADASQPNGTLLSNGKGDGTDAGGSLNKAMLGFENGKLTYQNNSFKIQADGNYLDNNWHHVALAVNRNAGNAQLLVDGLLNKFFDAKNLGGLAAAFTYVGARAYNHPDSSTVTTFDRYFKGNIDEVRIWNTYLNQALVAQNNNTRLNGNEIGLLAYYPFEKYIVFQNNREQVYSLADAKIQTVPNTVVPNGVATAATETSEKAPVKDRGPEDNLKFDFVVNNDALIINLQEPRQAIDKTVITFKVKNVRDLNGNPIVSPVTWTAYIDQNQLKWSDNELNLTKDVYAPMQFESYLVNNGGTAQRYTIGNLPNWLKATPSGGTIDPRGRQKISFEVNAGLNIGSYEELVFMRNDNNEAEALAINLKVNGKQPAWSVNPANYKYSMNVYGKIRINNVFSTNKEDILAAFVNGKCVGITRNTYLQANDFWYAFLTVYSDSLQQNNLEFRLWQATTGKTFLATPSIPVAFANNAVAGTPANPVIFDGREQLLQDITLQQNWNWISFNLANPAFANIGNTLANGKWAAGDIVKNELLGFSQYSAANGWVGYLSGFNNTGLFMLKSANAQTLSINGTAVDVKTTGIPLKGNRWNYISYLPPVNTTVKEALAGYVAADEDIIKSQTGFSMYSKQNGWIGNLNFLEPGKGYMLYRKATADTTFFYPSLAGSLTNTNPRGIRLNALQVPVADNYNYAGNMTVVATLVGDFDWKPGDSLVAYAAGNVKAKALPLNNPDINKKTWFFTIAGEVNQPVYFAIERSGQLLATANATVNYQTNAAIGTLKKPLELSFATTETNITVYPNPFSKQLTLTLRSGGHLNTPQQVQVTVYDAQGRVVMQQPMQTIVSYQYQTTWNGKNQRGTECSKGIYFVHITVNGKPNIYKVIKQ